jgi:hypothetical protein
MGKLRAAVAPTPPVFSQKSPQAIENKARGYEKKLQESSRVRKRMKARKLRKPLDDERLKDLGERNMRMEAEGGIGGIVGEKEMQSSDSGAGWCLALRGRRCE